jgi:hypothetical protein
MWVFTLIASILLLLGFSANGVFALKLSAYMALFAGILSFPTKNGVFQFGKYLFLVGMGIIFTVALPKTEGFQEENIQYQEFYNKAIIAFWIVFIIASIISAVIAVYAYRNIGEILSRRMLYRNSNIGIFEYTWLYTLDRFCNISLSITVCATWIIGVIGIIWIMI